MSAPGLNLAAHREVSPPTSIVDDVIYFAEPMFQDGIIAQAVDHVAGAGVSYFSSAGNYGRDSYEAEFRVGALGPTGTLHDFDPGPGIDTSTHVRPSRFRQGRRSSLSSGPNRTFRAGGVGSASDLDIRLFFAGCSSFTRPRRRGGERRERSGRESSASPTPEDRSPSDSRSPIRRGRFRGA